MPDLEHDSAPLGELTGPFVMDLFGGSPKTVTYASAISTGGTTAPESQSGSATSLSDRETRSSFARPKAMPSSHGAFHDTDETDRKASSAVSSATKARTSRRSLSDRLTLSLISSGLVCGTTPSLTRKQSGQPIQVLALDTPGGGAAARQREGSSSSNASSSTGAA